MDAGCLHRESTPPQRYGNVDDSNVFTRVPIPNQRLVVLLACDHKGYHPPVGLGHVFAILLAIPVGLERLFHHVPIRMRVQSGVVYLRHHGIILQHARHGHSILSVHLHSHVEGA